MEVMLESKATLSELCKEINIFPQQLVSVKVKDKKAFSDDTVITEYVAELSKKLGKDGRILVRESGTEPVIRVMAEAKTDELCRDMVERIVAKITDRGHALNED